MALKAGRVGLNKELVDEFGYLKEDAPSGEYYTKTQADNKFETKTHVNNNFQKKTLEVPIELLSGSALNVESALQGLNEEKQNMTLSVPIELLSGSALTVESALQGLNEEKFTYADNGKLGAKNLFYPVKSEGGATADITESGKVIRIYTDVAGTYKMARFRMPCVANTDYILSFNAKYTSGKGNVVVSSSNNVDIKSFGNIITDTDGELLFNSANNTSVIVKLLCTSDVSEVGDITFNNVMLRLATDPDDIYVPYAMTNREITEELAVQESACTDVISGATATKNHIVKYGKVVFLSLEVTGITATAHTDTIAKIPDGFKPNYTVNLDVSGTDAAYIGANGSIALRQDVSNRTLIASATWIVS